MRLACLAVVSTLVGCANANPDDASLAVSPTSLTLSIGQSVMVAATSERADVTNLDWEVDDPAIATVVAGNAGAATVTGVATGETRLVARLGNVERTIDVVVGSAAIESLEVTAVKPMVPAGLDIQLVATAHFTDGSAVDVSSMASWITGNDQVATVDAHGDVTAVAIGNADISATLMGEKGVLTISVTTAVLESIAVAKPATIAKGLTAQLAAMGTYSDGATVDLTSSVTWSTVDSTVATIAAGLVHGIGVGTTEIDCIKDDVTGSTTVDVGAAIVESIDITPSPLS
ncbi:MAG TPA: Ig-like domain-containing protein, partial [Kofleriaceae bacterium]|nr:Ig-like domain-containing protein [Kofleriaceae bacterium]